MGVGQSVACGLQSTFRCEADSQCGEQGLCEPVGHCSFPDADCLSQRRFDVFAGRWSGACVESSIADASTGDMSGETFDGGEAEAMASGTSPSSTSETPLNSTSESGLDSAETLEPMVSDSGEQDSNDDGIPVTSDPMTIETCGDGAHNQDETDLDCGGICGGTCTVGQTCTAGGDCVSAICEVGMCMPAPSCIDGERNRDETDTDCGGADLECTRCADGRLCAFDRDCQRDHCVDGRCVSCLDQSRNGDETDLDCGGSCDGCDPGQACIAGSDCASGVCVGGACCGGVRQDCTRCAEQLSVQVDCNDTASSGDANNCISLLACMAANANICSTRNAPGCTNDPGGVCNPAQFGGTTGGGDLQATRVLQNAQCQLN